MLLSAAQALYKSRYKLPDVPPEYRCWLCGGPAFDAQPISAIIRPTFTDSSVARGDADAGICVACAWFMSEQREDLRDWLGKDKLQKPRNYSHFLVDGAWHVLSKAQKRQMSALLTGEYLPEVAIVAVSGQKHLAFKARLNPPPERNARVGHVLFEEQQLWLNLDDFTPLFSDVNALYQAGYSKTSILSGQYTFYKDSDVDLWRTIEPRLKRARGSATFALAVYLAWLSDESESEANGQSYGANSA